LLVAGFMLRADMLPGGSAFALTVLFVLGTVSGYAAEKMRLPALIGMLVAGIIARNVGLIDGLDAKLSSLLRGLAVAVIMVRAGMGLDVKKLRENMILMLSLSVIPCLAEALGAGFFSTQILDDFPLPWGMLLGFILSDVSPAVTTPLLLRLQDDNYGKAKGIPTILLAAGNVNSVLAIVGYGMCFSQVFPSDQPVWMIVMFGFLELIGGVIVGVLVGWIVSCERVWRGAQTPAARAAIALLCAALMIFGGKFIKKGGGGAIAALSAGATITAAQKKRGQEATLKPIDDIMTIAWKNGGQTMLFSLLGGAIALSELTYDVLYLGATIVCVGIVFRVIAVPIVLKACRSGWNTWELMFTAITWCPKATVQAALSTVALEFVEANIDPELYGEVVYHEQKKRAMLLLNVAVLSIVMTAPLFGALMGIFGPLWLERETESSDAKLAGAGGHNDEKKTETSDTNSTRDENQMDFDV